jgi:hypothetical protein
MIPASGYTHYQRSGVGNTHGGVVIFGRYSRLQMFASTSDGLFFINKILITESFDRLRPIEILKYYVV